MTSFVGFVTAIGVKLTPAQRVLVSVAYDGIDPVDLADDDRDLAFELFGPVDRVPVAARQVSADVVGARSGKSYVLCALKALHAALTVPLDTLAPGELASATIIAPDIRLARQTLRFALGAAERVPAIRKRITKTDADRFQIVRPEDGRGVVVECLPATRGGSAVRGRSLVCAVLDECAFFRGDDAVVNDAEIFKAVAPRVLPGGQTIIASTPWSEAGLLYEIYSENFGNPVAAVVAHAPSELMRPGLWMSGIIALERRRDPENCDREFGANFLTASGTGAFFDPKTIDAAVEAGRQ